MFCHYGVGGPAFGAWRELAAHVMTTNWVLTGEFAGFPVMYHWRILPDSAPLPEELADIDRGLAISSRFEVANDERAFFDRHRNYDRCYAAMYTGQWLVAEFFGAGRAQREASLRAYAAGGVPTGIPDTAAAIRTRDAPVAVAMTEFFDLLRYETRRAPYPAELLAGGGRRGPGDRAGPDHQ
ncbi:hypothetical protein [Nocardia sp. NPDC050717]|uniref:hypothetical protein n=1 Tax=Nocardia sp. NPDC050717 TaxID=3157221 RepID=UPI0033E0C93F